MKAYMRDRFEFLGIPTPQRRALSRPFRQARGDFEPIVRQLWRLPQREYQYFALELAQASRRHWRPEHLELWRHCLESRSWWDTVDVLASHHVGELVRRFPELTAEVDGWLDSPDFWLQRASLLHQLHYKEATDERRLFAACERLKHSSEFFLRKAIGWALRQYARQQPERVRAYVEQANLSPLSRREALKHLT